MLTLLCKIVTVNLQIYIVTSYFVMYDVLLLKRKLDEKDEKCS